MNPIPKHVWVAVLESYDRFHLSIGVDEDSALDALIRAAIPYGEYLEYVDAIKRDDPDCVIPDYDDAEASEILEFYVGEYSEADSQWGDGDYLVRTYITPVEGS